MYLTFVMNTLMIALILTFFFTDLPFKKYFDKNGN